MPEEQRRDQNAALPQKKRKSPDDDGSPSPPSSTRNNKAGGCHSGAVLGVPVTTVQSSSGNDRDPGGDGAKPFRLPNGGWQEGGKPAEDGDNRARLVWSQELHNRFLNALSHLGLSLAVPKSILGLMEVDGMTRENIASHLQKYRLFLKKMGGYSSKDTVSADRLQELHEENVRREAMHEAMHEAALSVDESDSNVAAVDQPRLRNVAEGIPITAYMPTETHVMKMEKELLDPRNLQYRYPAFLGVGPPAGRVAECPPQPECGAHVDVHRALQSEAFDEKAAEALAGTAGGQGGRVRRRPRATTDRDDKDGANQEMMVVANKLRNAIGDDSDDGI